NVGTPKPGKRSQFCAVLLPARSSLLPAVIGCKLRISITRSPMIKSVTISAFALALALPAAAQKRAITFEDFSSVRAVSDPQPSPDGRTVLYAVRLTDVAANRRASQTFAV